MGNGGNEGKQGGGGGAFGGGGGGGDGGSGGSGGGSGGGGGGGGGQKVFSGQRSDAVCLITESAPWLRTDVFPMGIGGHENANEEGPPGR